MIEDSVNTPVDSVYRNPENLCPDLRVAEPGHYPLLRCLQGYEIAVFKGQVVMVKNGRYLEMPDCLAVKHRIATLNCLRGEFDPNSVPGVRHTEIKLVK